MKVGCCGLGIFAVIFKAISKVLEAIVAVIVYMGLYVPMFYLLMILGLWLWGGMTFVPSVELTLFYVGLGMSILASIIITLRHLIFEPFGAYLDRREEQRVLRNSERDRSRRGRHEREAEDERRRHYEDERRRQMDRQRYRERVDLRERPRVYRSRYDSSLIIYEFSDRFEVYREGPRGLYRIDIKWK